jgi:hypothetical protein
MIIFFNRDNQRRIRRIKAELENNLDQTLSKNDVMNIVVASTYHMMAGEDAETPKIGFSANASSVEVSNGNTVVQSERH